MLISGKVVKSRVVMSWKDVMMFMGFIFFISFGRLKELRFMISCWKKKILFIVVKVWLKWMLKYRFM